MHLIEKNRHICQEAALTLAEADSYVKKGAFEYFIRKDGRKCIRLVLRKEGGERKNNA